MVVGLCSSNRVATYCGSKFVVIIDGGKMVIMANMDLYSCPRIICIENMNRGSKILDFIHCFRIGTRKGVNNENKHCSYY